MTDHLESFAELGIDAGAWDDGESESAAWYDDDLDRALDLGHDPTEGFYPDDLDLDRALDLGHDPTEGFYPEWDGPSADELALDQREIEAQREQGRDDSVRYIPVDFLPPFDPDDIPF